MADRGVFEMTDRTQANSATHTPTPWRVGPDNIEPFYIAAQDLGMTAFVGVVPVPMQTGRSEAENRANAAFIVEACNSYASLKDRNEFLEGQVEGLQESFSAVADVANTVPSLKARIQELEAELASCRACREKIDCISRDWNYTGPGLLGPSCKD
jgi:hypothetical protein